METRLMKTVAFIQARMSSSRLPGKVLADIAGLPAIVFMAQRVARARHIDRVVVLTSEEASDDPLVQALACAQLACVRGKLDDVLQRFVQGAEQWPADAYVRLTGDCPLIDPGLVDAVVAALDQPGIDYASNVDPPSFPDGLDVEAFTAQTLARAHSEARSAPEREHVTLWMRSDTAGLKRRNLSAIVDLSSLRLTVDYPDDLELVRRVAAALPQPIEADLFDILRALCSDPALSRLNPHERNEGLARSLVQDTASRRNP
jgi:spore coat polysaccharide biosynthesis protein SpsF